MSGSEVYAGRAAVEILLKDQQFMRSLRLVEYRMSRLKNSMPKWNFNVGASTITAAGNALVQLGVKLKVVGDNIRVVSQGLRNIGRQIATIGAAGLFALGVSVKDYVDFSDAIQSVKAFTQTATAGIAKVREQALSLAKVYPFSPKQVAGAQAQLGLGGFSPKEIEATTESVLSLALATRTELGPATDTLIGTLRQFGLESTEAERAATTMALTVTNSVQTMEDYSEAMEKVGPIAKSVGLSLEEVSAVVGIMANANYRGSLAGTGLRRMLLNLSDPAIKERFDEIMESFGRTAPDFKVANGNFKNFTGTMEALRASLEGLGSADQLAAINVLFGRGTVGAVTIGENLPNLVGLIGYLTEGKTRVADLAEVMEGDLGGALRLVNSAFQDLRTKIGEALSGPLKGLSVTLRDLLDRVTAFIESNKDLVTYLVGVVITATATSVALFALGVALNLVSYMITGFGAALRIAGIPLIGFGKLIWGLASGNPLAIISAALGGLTYAVLKFTPLGKGLKDIFESYTNLAGGRIAGVFEVLKESLEAGDILNGIKIIGPAIKREFNTIANDLEKTFPQLFSFLGELASGDLITEFLGDITDQARQFAVVLGEAGSYAWGLLSEAIGNIAQSATDTWNWIVSGFVNMGQRLVDLAKTIGKKLGTYLLGAVLGLITGGESIVFAVFTKLFGKGIGKAITLAIRPIRRFLKNILDAPSDSGYFTKLFAVNVFLGPLMKAIKFASDGIKRILGGAWDFVASMMNAVMGLAWETLVASAVAVWNVLSTVFMVGIQWVGGLFVALGQAIWGVFAALAPSVAKFFEILVSNIFSSMAGMAEGIRAVFSDWGYFVEGYWKAMQENLTSGFEDIGDDWDKAIAGMFSSWSGFTAGITKMWQFAGTYLLQGILKIGEQFAWLADRMAEFIGIETDFQASVQSAMKYNMEGYDNAVEQIDKERDKRAAEREAASAKRREDRREENRGISDFIDQYSGDVQETLAKIKREMEEKEAKLSGYQYDDDPFAELRTQPGDRPAGSPEDAKAAMIAAGAFNIAAGLRLQGGQSIDRQILDELRRQTVELREGNADRPEVETI